MLDKKLVLRDLVAFSKNSTEKLRTESSRRDELGREAILDLMRIKMVDERRYYRECKRVRERIRDIVPEKIGKRGYDNLMRKLKIKIEAQKRELKKKYASKTEILEKQREKNVLAKLEEIPVGLEKYSRSKVFSRAEMEKMQPVEQKVETIGKVKIDEDESSILRLNPKFAVLKKLVIEDMEHDIEICNAKLRYEKRRRNEII